ncbi:ligase-associated DNA damage response DEXH box helicase [Algoriphagus halophytocola]|uniref:Ligase-associated DNA damage response DEXH box helicase n=1 Tax=Algoriphagus halophytocola TaxID=2991499 RepID=A0ABY6MKQ7_9BACT|nr:MULTISPECIES: ligase-associated DNA damage response DEXH box helicase [unclassified Algoriphagus]UZD23758.1 ligase-associated DNA damage response DEXH box helicase [Algoriphagus sp. TR-M5]WBL45052.1 ligase-associated DNA damage response DEXH box helicase [Algoriphagus sp. TR-M9]
MKDTRLAIGLDYFEKKGWTLFDFQRQTWNDYLDGKSGLLNAPTGSGKTFALWFPVILEYIQRNPDTWKTPKKNGIQVIWVTPLRALAQDIQKAMQEVCEVIGLPWQVAVRNGDTDAKTRAQLKRNPPECLITTPETLHILISQKEHQKLFKNIQAVVVDEWHELVGNKRGVQVQLALEYMQAICPGQFRRWAISATIGNLDLAARVLLGEQNEIHFVKAKIKKQIILHSLIPDEIEKYPWHGHLGLRMLEQVIPVIEAGKTVLLFTNTRSQTELWYQKILEARPDWAGWIAMHHGSLDMSVRAWVENALHSAQLKLVVCTSSLDLGVDFRPVDRVIQVGSPKGVARFMQRAGRASHQPGLPSEIFFVPTNSLELIEAAALRNAIQHEEIESQYPPVLAFDVLIQFLVTLAVGEGFDEKWVYQVVKKCWSYRSMTEAQLSWIMDFITKGGNSLGSYEDFLKVVQTESGIYKVTNRRIAMKHRLSMGTIVSEAMIKVKFKNGAYLGTVEESFISKMKNGDRFFFTGRHLELLQVKGLTAFVKLSEKKTKNVVSWMGARMSLSSRLADKIREILESYNQGIYLSTEIHQISPILALQNKLSIVPNRDTFLIEAHQSQQGYHLFFYPFEGRAIHELMSALIAYRISVSYPVTFSMAMNDYGFELLCDSVLNIEEILEEDVFSLKNLREDILRCVNETEMTRRKFREIASIAGLVFQGYPGKPTSFKHVQANSSLLFQVFEQYDPDNLLLRQAHGEAIDQQMEEDKMIHALQKINSQQIIVKHPVQFTPFSFPIMVDRLSRTSISSESIEDRVAKIQAQFTVQD